MSLWQPAHASSGCNEIPVAVGCSFVSAEACIEDPGKAQTIPSAAAAVENAKIRRPKRCTDLLEVIGRSDNPPPLECEEPSPGDEHPIGDFLGKSAPVFLVNRLHLGLTGGLYLL